MSEPEKVLKNPPELQRLYDLRQRLSGTDRDDHLEELSSWERRIKKSLIFLNLKGHEGIDQLLARADEEIAQINEKLLAEQDYSVDISNFTPERLIAHSIERQRLYDLRTVWKWFKSLFEDAEEGLNEANAFLTNQETPDFEDEYVGKFQGTSFGTDDH